MKRLDGKFKAPVYYIPKMQNGRTVPPVNPLPGVEPWYEQRPDPGPPTKDQYKYNTPLYGMTGALPAAGMGVGAIMQQGALMDRPDMGMGIAGGALSGASQGAMIGGPFGALAGAALGAGKRAIQTGMARQNYDMARQQEYDNMIKQNTLSGSIYQTKGEVNQNSNSIVPIIDLPENIYEYQTGGKTQGRIHNAVAPRKSAPMHPYLVAYMKQAFENAAPNFELPALPNRKSTRPSPIPAYEDQEIVASVKSDDSSSYLRRSPVQPITPLPRVGIYLKPQPKPDTSSVPIVPPEMPMPEGPILSESDLRDYNDYSNISPEKFAEITASIEKARKLFERRSLSRNFPSQGKFGGPVPKYQTDGIVYPNDQNPFVASPPDTLGRNIQFDTPLDATEDYNPWPAIGATAGILLGSALAWKYGPKMVNKTREKGKQAGTWVGNQANKVKNKFSKTKESSKATEVEKPSGKKNPIAESFNTGKKESAAKDPHAKYKPKEGTTTEKTAAEKMASKKKAGEKQTTSSPKSAYKTWVENNPDTEYTRKSSIYRGTESLFLDILDPKKTVRPITDKERDMLYYRVHKTQLEDHKKDLFFREIDKIPSADASAMVDDPYAYSTFVYETA